jgi:iron complex outermembrane recepter protein
MKYFLIFAITFFVSSSSFADAVKTDSVKYRFNPVVVTATKVQGAQRDIAASVFVLDEPLIKNAISSSALEFVKDHVPGFFITERSVMGYGVAQGSAGGISIRGVGGSPTTGVLILRDGRPDIMGMMGHPLPDAYSLDGLERVEVVRGPASFLYGTNAMGGVINLVSKKMRDDGFQTRLSAGAGNFNSQKYNVQHGGKINNLDYFINASSQRTDGHRVNSDYEGSLFSGHLGYSFSENASIEFNANYSDIYLFDPGISETPVVDHWYDIVRSGADISVNHNSRLGESYLKLHGNFGEHRIYDGWRSNDRTIGAMFYHNAELWNGNTSTVGFDYKKYGGDALDSFPQIPVIDYGEYFMTEWAPYAHIQQMLWNRFVASAGVRFEQHNLYDSELLPKVGLVMHATSFTAIRVSAAKGFRSPSIRELYIFPPRNEELEPERMWNYEIGVTQSIGLDAEIEAVVFQAIGDNLIRMQFPGGKPQFFNSGEFEHTGYELMARWRPSHRLNMSATWSDTNLGDETLGAPEQKMTFYAGYNFGLFNLMGTVLQATNLYGADKRQGKLADYTILNIAASVAPWKSLSLRLSLKNAFDQRYQTISGYPMPGRTFMSELSFTY